MKHIWGRRLAAAAAVLMGAGIVVAGAAPANAGTIGQCYRFQFASSGMRMTVEDNTDGGRIVQQWAQDGPRYTWCEMPPVGTDVNQIMLQNASTKRCLASDGVAGHALTQQPCHSADYSQHWLEWSANYNGQTVWSLSNVQYGLSIDVYGDSHAAGAVIDGWHQGSGRQLQLNQAMYEV